MIDTVLSVDIGTTSLKAGLITADGEVVFICRKKYRNSRSKTVANQWVKVFYEAFDSALLFCKTDELYNIKAIGISGNGPTLVNEAGVTLLWNNKNVHAEKAELLEQNIQKELNGIPSLFLPKILLFQRLYPQDFSSAKLILSGPEFLIYKLTGNPVTILPEKRYESAYWNRDLLLKYGLEPQKFPDFVSTAANCGTWNGLPVFAGGPDFIVALIGTNTLEAGKICDRSGSSEGINYCINKAVFEKGIRTLPSVIPGLWNCSVLIPDSSRLTKTGRVKKLKEAVSLLRLISAKYKMDFPLDMKVTGGQTKDTDWMQEKAKFLKMNLRVCSCSDSELLGDASVAWFGLGEFSSLVAAAEKIVRIEREYPAEGMVDENL